MQSNDGVVRLLSRLVSSIESAKCRETTSSLVDFYLSAAVHSVPNEKTPLAKVLPPLVESFHSVSSSSFDSPLQNSLCSSDVHKFAMSAVVYGSCVSNQAERIVKGACSKEFEKLIECFKEQVSFLLFHFSIRYNGLDFICSKKKPNNIRNMKVKRYKRANRILTFFKYNFKFQSPYRVLVDGTFCNAALINKINLREQMPKYLGGEVEIVTTSCVLAELEKIGQPVYGALVICRQFDVDPCPHKPCRSAVDCLAHLARRAVKGKTKYFIATEDDSLTDKLRNIAGTPILYIKYNAILLDRVSEVTKKASESAQNENEKIKEIRKALLGEVEKKKKKRKLKGKNPLSCKKKKMKVEQNVRTGQRTMSGKRKRTKKTISSSAENGDQAKL
uniref:rRNA-processing protein UTP23 homolog n=1 Tax=Heterorhabditis bacteriophora TaxID=37862 RepID=A0A1I7XU04_HETBA